MSNEFWNREELYAEVWEKPLIKISPKYGISAVALGKICRKLHIPLPGRGYWVKKDFGKPVKQIPLPAGKDVPVLRRTEISQEKLDAMQQDQSQLDPNDPELVRIAGMENSEIVVDPQAKQHKLVSVSDRQLKRGREDDRGILVHRGSDPILDLRVSSSTLERGLRLINTVILALEAENFPVSVQAGRDGTGVEIFGRRVPFALVEKVRVTGQREVKEHSWTRKINEYQLTGYLELRVGGSDYGKTTSVRDGKTRKLEDILSLCIGKLMRTARKFRIDADLAEKRRLEREEKQREMDDLARRISEEEKNLKDLDRWVVEWDRAEKMRSFVVALEKVWAEAGHDLSPESPKRQRLNWMKQQADRADPMIPGPPSVLDRKGELSRWW